MSGTAMSEPTNESYRLSLGRGDRSIIDQGEGAEMVNSGVVASPGARRSIVFHFCKLRGDIEIDGRKLDETPIAAYVHERSPDRPLWNEPWECPENGGMTPREVRSVGSIADRGNGDAMGVGVDCDGG